MAKEKSPRPKMEPPPPRCKAILLCQRAIIEAGSGRISLIDLLTGFVVEANMTGPFSIYLQLIEGISEYEYNVTVELHDLLEGSVVGASAGTKLTWNDRLRRINLLIPIRSLTIQHPGFYDLVVLANKQEIDRQKFSVAIMPPSSSEDHGNE